MRLINGFAFVLAFSAATGLGAVIASAQTTSTRPAFGCFRVSAKSLDIHEGAASSSAHVATVSRGDLLIKRRRFCGTLIPSCAVKTEKGVEGFAAKGSIKVAPCPARLSTKVN